MSTVETTPVTREQAKANALACLAAAVKTQLVHWDAMNALETALGFPDGSIDRDLDEMLVEFIKSLAAGSGDDGSDVEMYHIDMIAKDMRVKF